MATVDFTLEDVRKVVCEEATDVVRNTVPGIVHNIVNDTVPEIARNIIHQEIMAERIHTKHMMEDVSGRIITEIMTEVVKVRKMLEEDAQAENERLSKVDKRLEKTTRLLLAHISHTTAHRA